MNNSNPANLAVIACPGGEVFSAEVIVHLKKEYRHNLERLAAELAKRYNMDTTAVIQYVNFINEVVSPVSPVHAKTGAFNIPRFNMPARFTIFANGEIKAEILESIRGKDIYIGLVQ
jgi:ribose-phosphate pyrophosphokinase